MNSKFKGSLAVAQCIAKLYQLGYEVLLPVGDRLRYDLVFDDGLGLHTVQVKYAGKYLNNKYIAGLRTTGGNQSYNYAKKYENDDFEYLYVFTGDRRHFLIRWDEIKVRNSIVIDDKKYLKYMLD